MEETKLQIIYAVNDVSWTRGLLVATPDEGKR
jgi:hypothetical protein